MRLHSETELLELIASGDDSAFAELFSRYRDRVYTISFKLARSNIIAEEIVQDVFLKIWQKRAELKKIENFNAYLFIVTRNYAYNVLKDSAPNHNCVILSEEDQTLVINDASDLLMGKEYSLLLQNAIDRLPNQQKQVYSLIKDRGFKREEVARELQIQPETVKFHLAQAMKNIRAFCMMHLSIFLGFITFFSGVFRK